MYPVITERNRSRSSIAILRTDETNTRELLSEAVREYHNNLIKEIRKGRNIAVLKAEDSFDDNSTDSLRSAVTIHSDATTPYALIALSPHTA